jgi:molybdenum cofactor cytidylyltransferase
MIIRQPSIIILAAGRSARMGMAKQNLAYKGRTLLQHAIEQAKATGLPVWVVQGAYALQVSEPDVQLVINKDWDEGMASSIRAGITEVVDHGSDAALIMVCDQPYVLTDTLLGMLELQKQTAKGIVAAEYDGKPGTPALFHRELFPLLLTLQGDKGAKQLIQDNKQNAVFFGFPEGITDIDTPGDYDALLNENKQDDQGRV